MRVMCIGLDGRVGIPDLASYVSNWTREMAALVDEYVVIAETRRGPDIGPVKLADNASAYVVAASAARYPFAAARLARRLHAERPFDICTTEDPMRSGLAGALFSRATGVPLNVENHSFHINEPIFLRARPHHRLYNLMGIWVTKRAHSIRNYSPDQEPPLLKLGIPQSRLFCVPAPAPVMNFPERNEARRDMGFADDEQIVLTVGRLVPYKNLGVLLEAMAILRKTRPVRLVVLGDGPSMGEWTAQTAALGLSDAVEWCGRVPAARTAPAYAGADVFVAPAVHETGPRTVMEAFGASCPVVATPHMGVVHFGLCEHEQTALVVDHTDVNGMADAIAWLLDNPDKARAMADEGYRRTEERCPVPAVARQLVDVFRETIAIKQESRQTAGIAGRLM